MRETIVASVVCAMALAGGLGVAEAVDPPPAEALNCSSYTYYPSWGAFNRQGLTNSTDPNRLYFYQRGKVGRSGAVAGEWTTGGVGVHYCGTNYYYSVDKNL
ncbi:MAG TPA: hypothetical protein VGC57_16650 [Cellulomonas sp.]